MQSGRFMRQKLLNEIIKCKRILFLSEMRYKAPTTEDRSRGEFHYYRRLSRWNLNSVWHSWPDEHRTFTIRSDLVETLWVPNVNASEATWGRATSVPQEREQDRTHSGRRAARENWWRWLWCHRRSQEKSKQSIAVKRLLMLENNWKFK